MQISNKSWKQIDKSKLPKECLFEGTNLPYREAVNGKAGPVNVGALRAALVACNEMKSIPAKLEGQIVSVLTELRDGEYAGEMYCRASFMMALGEGFMSLDQTMRNAVKEKFGTEAWMTDFSDQEVIFELPVKKPQTVATGSEIAMSSRQLFAVGYEIKRDGTVVLGDEDPVPVERAVIYEPIDTAEQLFHTVMDLMDGAVVLENLLDEKGKVGKFIDKIAKGVSGTTETPYALAVWKAKEKFGKKKVSKAMSKKKMTKEKLELEQSKAEKHSAIADRFHTLEKKYKERGHKNRAYLAHRVAAKHAAIAKEAMELLDEYGVQGMKWGEGE